MLPRLIRRRPRLSFQEALSARPVRLVPDDRRPGDRPGSTKLVVPLRQGAFGRFFQVPVGATKSFELDEVGVFVWEKLDGRTSVKQVIRLVASRWKLDERAAEVSTLQFIRLLIRRGLVGVPLRRGGSATGQDGTSASDVELAGRIGPAKTV